jgi:hypothetical protein
VTDAEKPDFEQNLVDFGSARFTQLRPGQHQVLAAYADQHLDIGNHRNHNLLNASYYGARSAPITDHRSPVRCPSDCSAHWRRRTCETEHGPR